MTIDSVDTTSITDLLQEVYGDGITDQFGGAEEKKFSKTSCVI